MLPPKPFAAAFATSSAVGVHGMSLALEGSRANAPPPSPPGVPAASTPLSLREGSVPSQGSYILGGGALSSGDGVRRSASSSTDSGVSGDRAGAVCGRSGPAGCFAVARPVAPAAVPGRGAFAAL